MGAMLSEHLPVLGTVLRWPGLSIENFRYATI